MMVLMTVLTRTRVVGQMWAWGGGAFREHPELLHFYLRCTSWLHIQGWGNFITRSLHLATLFLLSIPIRETSGGYVENLCDLGKKWIINFPRWLANSGEKKTGWFMFECWRILFWVWLQEILKINYIKLIANKPWHSQGCKKKTE